MNITIVGKNVDVTSGLRDSIEEKIGKLEKYFSEDTKVNVKLSVDKERHKIEVTIPLKGKIIRSEQVSNDMYVSIDLVEETIERQLKKYKNKLIDKHQDASASFKREFLEKEYVDDDEVKIDEMLIQLEKSIIAKWNDLVAADYADDPFTDEELENLDPKMQLNYATGQKIEYAYGTTMLVNVVTDEFWFGIHIGDGECVTVDHRGNFDHPIPHDKKCMLNLTTSICDRTAIYNMRHHFSRKLPKALFIASDGVGNCFINDEKLHNFYSMIMNSFDNMSESGAILELLDYLPKMSQKGSGDDLSLGIILRK